MKLYTKRGDYGNTNLIGGRTISKAHPRVEAYGSLDELNSWVGYTISLIPNGAYASLKEELTLLQHYLFDVGTDLADPDGKLPTKMGEEQIEWLEKSIDKYDATTPALEAFILPGGTPLASSFQVARTITRRAERVLIHLEHTEEVRVPVRIFVNRLSDYFFVIARWINHEEGITEPTYDRGGKVFHQEEKEKTQQKNQ